MLSFVQSLITCHQLDPENSSPEWVWWLEGIILKITYWPKQFRDRFIARHHIVDTGLKPGWHEYDELLFRACFQVLRRFVVEELGYPFGTDVANPAVRLYIWYSIELPMLESLLGDHASLEDLKTKKLHELISVRHSLWT